MADLLLNILGCILAIGGVLVFVTPHALDVPIELFLQLMKKLGVAPNYQSYSLDAKPDSVVGQKATITRKFRKLAGGTKLEGKVFVEGAHWAAVTVWSGVSELKEGDEVKVIGHEGLTLEIDRLST